MRTLAAGVRRVCDNPQKGVCQRVTVICHLHCDLGGARAERDLSRRNFIFDGPPHAFVTPRDLLAFSSATFLFSSEKKMNGLVNQP